MKKNISHLCRCPFVLGCRDVLPFFRSVDSFLPASVHLVITVILHRLVSSFRSSVLNRPEVWSVSTSACLLIICGFTASSKIWVAGVGRPALGSNVYSGGCGACFSHYFSAHRFKSVFFFFLGHQYNGYCAGFKSRNISTVRCNRILDDAL